jgi:hypothetical protein
MFTVDDLYKKNNIAKVTRCLEEIDKLVRKAKFEIESKLNSTNIFCYKSMPKPAQTSPNQPESQIVFHEIAH